MKNPLSLITFIFLSALWSAQLGAWPMADGKELPKIESSSPATLTSAGSSATTRVVTASEYRWQGSRGIDCQRQPEGRAEQVRASQYCDFLNQVAASDPHYFYNEAMESDPATACIVRVGEPGSYRYEVIAGRENFPIHYVSHVAQTSYADKLQAGTSCADRLKAEASEAGRLQATGYRLQEEPNDDYLSCNSETFEVEVPSTMLTLASSSPTSTSNFNSYITDVSGAVGFAALLALCPELMTRFGGDVRPGANESTALDVSSDRASDCSDTSDTSLQSCASSQSAASARTTASMGKRTQYTLGLVDFTTAALEHPMADRLIIDEGDTEAIIPSKSSVLDMSKSVKENKTIALAFKDVLRNEYSRELAGRLIPGQRDSVWDSFSLGSANIFQYINKVEKRITEHNILGTKESDLDALSSHVERKKINLTETQEFYEKHQTAFDAQSGEKTLAEKSDAAVGTLVDAVGGAHFMGLPVGPAVKIVAVGARKAELAIRSRPLKQAKKIAEGAKEDHDVVEKRLINFQRKEAKKNGTNPTKRGVRFGDPESPSSMTSPTTVGGIDLGIDPSVRGRIKLENDHVALWEEAVRLETAAQAAGFRAFQSDTPANSEAYIEACRLAKKAWTMAAEAREAAANKTANARDKNLLLADTTTAEEKADEWGRALKAVRAKHNKTPSISSIPSDRKIQDGDTQSPVDQRVADKKEVQKAIANATVEAQEKLVADQQAAAEVKAVEDRLAAMEEALKKAKEDVATTQAVADKKAAEEAKLFEERLRAATQQATREAEEKVRKKAAADEQLAAAREREARLAAMQAELEAAEKKAIKVKEAAEKKAAEDARFYEERLATATREARDQAMRKAEGKESRSLNSHDLNATLAQIAQLKLDVASDAKNGDQAWSKNKSDQSISWYRAENAKRHVIEELSAAIKAEEIGKISEGVAWRRIAEQRLLASTEFQQAAEALGRETPELEEAKNAWRSAWNNMRSALQQMRSIYVMREQEAITAHHLQEAEKWREVITANEKADQYYTEAIEALTSERIENAHDFYRAGDGLDWASDRLAKAIEAKAVGTPEKLEEATRWEEAVRESQKRSDYFLKAIEARAAGKAENATSWTNAAGGASLASDRLAKAIEARAVGTPEKLEEATGYEEAARESQKSSDYSLKAIEARAVGKADDATSWENAGSGASWASDRLGKAIEARAIGTPEKLEEATGYEEAARESQKRSEYHLKAIEARAAGKADDATSWENAGSGASWASSRLAKAIEARALGTPEKLEEATGYEEAARESQKRSEYHLKAIQARAAGKVDDATSWVNAAGGASWASERLAKAIEARAIGTLKKLEEATGYEEAARESQKRSDYSLKAIEARAAGKAEDATSWENAGSGASWASDRLAKAIEARIVGTAVKIDDATRWEEAVREEQKRSEYHIKVIKAIEARAPEKADDAKSWTNAGAAATLASARLAKAIEARVLGTSEKLIEAEQWEEAARESQKQSEYHLKAIEARAAGKADDATSWTNAANGASLGSQRLVKAIEARAAGKPEEAKEWEAAARESQRQSGYHFKAISDRTLGKERDAGSWKNALKKSEDAEAEWIDAMKCRDQLEELSLAQEKTIEDFKKINLSFAKVAKLMNVTSTTWRVEKETLKAALNTHLSKQSYHSQKEKRYTNEAAENEVFWKNNAIKVEQYAKVIKAKAAFVGAKNVWADFLRKAQIFYANPNDRFYESVLSNAKDALNLGVNALASAQASLASTVDQMSYEMGHADESGNAAVAAIAKAVEAARLTTLAKTRSSSPPDKDYDPYWDSSYRCYVWNRDSALRPIHGVERAMDEAVGAARIEIQGIWRKDIIWSICAAREAIHFAQFVLCGFDARDPGPLAKWERFCNEVRNLGEGTEDPFFNKVRNKSKKIQANEADIGTWNIAIKKSEDAENEWNKAMSNLDQIKEVSTSKKVTEQVMTVSASFRRAADCARAAEIAWRDERVARNAALVIHLPTQALIEADLRDSMNQAAKNESLWNNKDTNAKKIAETYYCIAIIKEKFAEAKPIWADFSRLAQAFVENPNKNSYSDAVRSAAIAENAVRNVFRNFPQHITNQIVEINHAQAAATRAAEAAHAASRLIEDGQIFSTRNVVNLAHAARTVAGTTQVAVVDHRETALYALYVEDVKWATDAAKEAADFAKAVVDWKESSKCTIQ